MRRRSSRLTAVLGTLSSPFSPARFRIRCQAFDGAVIEVFVFSSGEKPLGVMATGQPVENLDGCPRKWKQVWTSRLGIGNAHGPREVDVCPAGRNEFAAACSQQE